AVGVVKGFPDSGNPCTCISTAGAVVRDGVSPWVTAAVHWSTGNRGRWSGGAASRQERPHLGTRNQHCRSRPTGSGNWVVFLMLRWPPAEGEDQRKTLVRI